MTETFKEQVERIKNSPEMKKSAYARRARAIYLIILMPPFLLVGYIISGLFGLSDYFGASFGVVAIILASYLAERKATQRMAAEENLNQLHDE